VLYVLAILLPPVAMLLAGHPWQALIALVLMVTVIGWIPAAIWAFFVVMSHEQDKRFARLSKQLRARR
jgi:uncharacterized membrane protein YqaE (UPF0057 family)